MEILSEASWVQIVGSGILALLSWHYLMLLYRRRG